MIRMWSEDVTRGPSVRIWGDMSDIREDSDRGICAFYFNDFERATTVASATAQDGLYGFADTGGTITGAAINDIGTYLGALILTGGGTANDQTAIQFGRTPQLRLSNAEANASKVMFEVRLNTNDVTDGYNSIFAGLHGTVAANNSFDDTTGEVPNTTASIGFRTLNDDGNGMDAIYQAQADSSVQTVAANAAVLVANTFVKLGILYDPDAPDANYVTYFVDGKPVGYVTKTQFDTATFPEDEALVPMVSLKTFGSYSNTVYIDWVAFCMYQAKPYQ